MTHKQHDMMVTIRVNRCLAEMLKDVPNRSEFIRDAIKQALARQCPTCGGSGVLARVQSGHSGPEDEAKNQNPSSGRCQQHMSGRSPHVHHVCSGELDL